MVEQTAEGGRRLRINPGNSHILSIILFKVNFQRSHSRDCFHPCFFPQATIIVYQAVAEYWTNAKEPDYDLNVDVLLPGRSGPDKYKLNRENHYTTRTSKVKY